MMNLKSESGYKLPPENIVKIFKIPAFPSLYLYPFSEIGIETSYEKYHKLSQLAQPSEKLAGIEFKKKLNAPPANYPKNYLKIHNLKNLENYRLNLPENIKIRNYSFSLDFKKVAISFETDSGIRLLIADVQSNDYEELSHIKINDILEDVGFQWLNDNRTLLIKAIPENRGKVPEKPLVPDSPIIEETEGKKSTMRTYQNLLRNNFDEKLFDYYFPSQLVLYDSETKNSKKIGKPAIYDEIKISPDNKYILVEKIHKPYSYNVPYFYFPKSIEIIDLNGNTVKKIYDRPLQEEIPIGGTFVGPRKFQWQPQKDASLIWAEALDEGNPKNKVEFRDKIMRISAPFSDEPQEIFRTVHRYKGIDWSETEDELIYYEYDRDKLWKKGWLFTIGNDSSPQLVYDFSINEHYRIPGKLVKKMTKGRLKVFVKDGENVFYINNEGASPEGNYPFLAKYNFRTGNKEILFKCKKGFYETINGFIGNNFRRILIKSENRENPPNYFMVDLKTGVRTRVTEFSDFSKEISALKKEIVTYKRNDGILLSGELYLPADYQKGKRLPLVISAYPQEFADKKTAAQISASSNRFIQFWGSSVRYFALQGYAVLSKASIPIVGNPETVNETFIEQTVSSVKAAIDYLAKREIIDPERVGIVGHSYGAFMVANVLAHSNLCAAGIARSGAYNRTLTPFGFQRERRTLWEAKDFYFKVSPFMYAEKIKVPLLLIHGEDDPNSGTYPMQSQRFYQALKGNGGISRLVILPFEGHAYRAEESNLHVLAEMIDWFDKYVNGSRQREEENKN